MQRLGDDGAGRPQSEIFLHDICPLAACKGLSGYFKIITWESNIDLIVLVALPSGYVTNQWNLWEVTEATGSSVASVPGASSHQGENCAQVH